MGDAGVMGDGSEGSDGGRGTPTGVRDRRGAAPGPASSPVPRMRNPKISQNCVNLYTAQGSIRRASLPIFCALILVGSFDDPVTLARPEILNSLAGVTDHRGVRGEISSIAIAT